MTEEQRVAVRDILATLSSQFDIIFTEITDSASMTANFVLAIMLKPQRLAMLIIRTSHWVISREISYINNSEEVLQITNVVYGTNAYSTLIHEIGHTLGLKHPGNYNAASESEAEPGATEGPYLTDVEDSELFSIMSYTPQSQGLERINLAPYDYAALAYLYNAKPTHTGDDIYTVTEESGLVVQTIYDDGGNDTLDASSMSTPVILNLNVAAPGTPVP